MHARPYREAKNCLCLTLYMRKPSFIPSRTLGAREKSMIFLTALLCFLGFCEPKAELVVQIDSGKVSGWERISRDGRLYQAWTGIPYAAPPTGELRLKAPKPALKWEGVLDATGDPPACLHLNSWGIPHPTSKEDCLYLSVYRPKIPDRNLPVIVYVHGGAFQAGYSGPREMADFLMDEDVVLVSLQYRLSILGFMSLGDSVLPGNLGLKDQVMALKWVKQNIAAFGGNPNSVTVVGESAGGASAHLLLKSPACDDLIHRAVSDSGTITKLWSLLKPKSVRDASLAAAQKLGCLKQTSQETLKCLQELDASEMISPTQSDSDPSIIPFLPVIEPEDAEDPVATFDLSTRPTIKPWITSTCTGEWGLFKATMSFNPGNDVIAYLRKYFSLPRFNMTENGINEFAETLLERYFSSANDSEGRIDEAAKMQGDMFFHYPEMANIKRHQGPKWIYRFEYNGEMSRIQNAINNVKEDVVAHASTINSYFNMRSRVPGLSPKETPEDYKMSKRLIKYLVNFAYYDNPTPEPSPLKWLQFKNSEVLRVTGLGDYLADRETIKKLEEIDALWISVLGW